MIDTLRPVSLPEGAEITLRLAGPVARARAWLIDFGLRMVVLASLPSLISLFGDVGAGIYLIVAFALSTLYPLLFEALWNGQTPGKRACDLAVVQSDGTPVTWAAAILRNTVRIADALPLGYAIGLVSMACDRQFRRLGDLSAGTVVIHRDAPRPRAAAQKAAAAPWRPPVALTALEQRAVLDFDERLASWSPERAVELAEVAAPLVDGASGEAAVARVAGIASHLRGRR